LESFEYLITSLLKHLMKLIVTCWTQDPEVSAAFADVSQNPANMAKYANNPKVQNLIKKMQSKFAGPDTDDADTSDAAFGAAPSSDSSKPAPHMPHQPDID